MHNPKDYRCLGRKGTNPNVFLKIMDYNFVRKKILSLIIMFSRTIVVVFSLPQGDALG